MKFGVAGLKLENSGSLLSAFSWWDDGKTGTWETSGSKKQSCPQATFTHQVENILNYFHWNSEVLLKK